MSTVGFLKFFIRLKSSLLRLLNSHFAFVFASICDFSLIFKMFGLSSIKTFQCRNTFLFLESNPRGYGTWVFIAGLESNIWLRILYLCFYGILVWNFCTAFESWYLTSLVWNTLLLFYFLREIVEFMLLLYSWWSKFSFIIFFVWRNFFSQFLSF